MAYYPDISHWKPVKNWADVDKNCPFIISKATQGTNYIDSTLNSFIANCEKHGIPYWLYTFLNKGNEKAQAQYMVKVCKPKVGKYFMGYVLDVEQNNSAAGVKAALDYLKSLGGKCMIYTMYSQYSKYKDVIAKRGSSVAWWEARYGANNGKYSSAYPCHSGVDLHQYTSRGYCPGIGSMIDLNRVCGSKKIAWFTGASAPAKKDKTPVKKPTAPTGSTLTLVYKTMKGEYGDGATRKKKLGSRYNEVMKVINHIDLASAHTLASEVIAGKYGDGNVRKVVLGKRYKEVQNIVNKRK